MFNQKNINLSDIMGYVDIKYHLDDLIALTEHVINTFTENQAITEQERRENISRLIFIRNYFIEQKNQLQRQDNHDAAPRPR